MSDATVVCAYLGLLTAVVFVATRGLVDFAFWLLMGTPCSSLYRYMTSAADGGIGAFFITRCILAWAGK